MCFMCSHHIGLAAFVEMSTTWVKDIPTRFLNHKVEGYHES
jgi:hypothetical protein